MTGTDGAGDATGDPWARLLPALEAPCAACEGTGTVLSGDWRAWHERAGELVRVAQAARRATDLHLARAAVAQAVPLPNGAHPTIPEGIPRIAQIPPTSPEAAREAEPPAIVTVIDRAIDDHMATRPGGPERVRCETCGGGGLMLTAAGAGLMEFLLRHGLVPAVPRPPVAPVLNGHGGGAVQPGEDSPAEPPRGRREH